MKRMCVRRIVSWVLCLSLIICNMQVVAFASEFDGGSNSNGENEFVSSTFTFPSSQYYDYEIKSEFYYTDDYFKNPSTIYDDHMATMSLNFALASFASYYYDIKERSANARELFGKLGFNNVTPNNDYMEEPRKDTMGVICANKHIYIKEGSDVREYNLIAVGMRGSNYRNEWASNLKMGASGDHEGFVEARNIAYNHVKTFYDAHKNDFGNIPTKFWIAGFSRGGACANMLGGKLTDEASQFNTTKENIYVYTFEAPQAANTSVHTNLDEYTNIHNVVNPQDPVPKLGMSILGFRRYGIDHFIPTYKSENLHDATKRAEAHANNEAYLNDKPKVEKYLGLLDPSLKMTCEDFLVKDLTLVGKGGIMYLTDRGDQPFTPESKESDFYKQGEFFDYAADFIARDVLNSNFPGTSYTSQGRQRYNDYFQETVTGISEIVLKLDKQGMQELTAKIKNNIANNNFALLRAGLAIMGCVTNDGERNETIYSSVADFAVTILTGAISNEDLQFVKEHKKVLVDLLLDILIADRKFADRTVSGSIYGNNFFLAEGHGHEYLLAWLKLKDSYYTTPPTDVDYDDGYKSITLSNIENTTINIYVGTEKKGYIIGDASGNYTVHKDDDSVVFRMIKLLNPVSYELQIAQGYDYKIEIIPSVDTTYNSFGYHDKFDPDVTSYRNIYGIEDLKLLAGEKITVDLAYNFVPDVSVTYPWNAIPEDRRSYFRSILLKDKDYAYGVDEFPYSTPPKITKSIKIDAKVQRDDADIDIPEAGNFDDSYFVNQDAVKETIDLSTAVYKEIDLQRPEKAFVIAKNNVSAAYTGVRTYNNFDNDTKTETEMPFNDFSIYEIDPLEPKGVDHILKVTNVTTTTTSSDGLVGSITQNYETEPESNPETKESIAENTTEQTSETSESTSIAEQTSETTESINAEETSKSTIESSEASSEESKEESSNESTEESSKENIEESTVESEEESSEEGMVSGFTGTLTVAGTKYTIAVPNGEAMNASDDTTMYATSGETVKIVVKDEPTAKRLTAIKIIKENGGEQQIAASLNTPVNYVMTEDNIYIKPVFEDIKSKVEFDGDTYAKLYDEDDVELHSGAELLMGKEIQAKAPWFSNDYSKKFFAWTLLSKDGKLLNNKELMSTVYINLSNDTHNICSFKVPNYDISIVAHYVDMSDEEKEENKRTLTYDDGESVTTKRYYIGSAVGFVARATYSDLPLQSFKVTHGTTNYYIIPPNESYFENGYEYKGGAFKMPEDDVNVKAIYSKDPPPTPPGPTPPYNPGGSGGDSSGGSDNVKQPAGYKKDDNGSLSWNGGGVIWKVFDKDKNDYVKNSWVNLYYNGKQKWYYFGEDGTMKVGWITYKNATYFLQVVYNDTFGAMLTGIQNIDGKVYEFSNTGELLRVVE